LRPAAAAPEVAGRIARHERHPHDAPAPRFYLGGAHDVVSSVVSALDQHVGPQRGDEGPRGVGVEQHDAVDAAERREQAGAVRARHDGAVPALPEPAHGGVAVHADHERRALGTRGLQQAHVPDVQQVEHAVGEHDGAALALPPRGGLVGGAELGGSIQGSYSGWVALG